MPFFREKKYIFKVTREKEKEMRYYNFENKEREKQIDAATYWIYEIAIGRKKALGEGAKAFKTKSDKTIKLLKSLHVDEKRIEEIYKRTAHKMIEEYKTAEDVSELMKEFFYKQNSFFKKVKVLCYFLKQQQKKTNVIREKNKIYLQNCGL